MCEVLYTYVIYGINTICNVKLPFFKERRTDSKTTGHTVKLNINVNKRFEPDNRSYIQYFSNGCKLDFGTTIYLIDFVGNEIYCETADLQNVVASLFNVPYSIILAHNGYIPLHCSSCVHNERLISYAGAKGIGKSTILLKSAMQGAKFYSDDVLALRFSDMQCYANELGGNFKYKRDCFDKFKPFILENSEKIIFNAAADKYFVQYKNGIVENGEKCLKTVFMMRRTTEIQSVVIDEIKDVIVKKALFLKNIVSIKYYNDDLIKRILSSDTLQQLVDYVRVIDLNLPDDADYTFNISQILNKAGL